MKFLNKNKIGCQVHYKPLYKHNYYKKIFLLNHYKNSDVFYKQSISLPMHTRMQLKDVQKVVEVIKKFYKK
jgi:UDP-4-amino-4,6-dideoxy-L-N-acetyl-beta-L-altrosamine transaminase